jgi:hypothetical protein
MRSHRSDEWPCSKGAALALTVAAALGLAACNGQPKPGTVLDEAMRAQRTAASFPAADEDYFHDMDGALPLTKEQIEGRNMWVVWAGGNDRLWDVLSRESLGSLDFLKTISSHPTLPYSRDNRWNYLGLVNEPCFKKATGPDPSHFGLWLDVRDPACGPDPFANADKYKGVQVGARGKTVPVGSYYGEPTGVVGLRLLPNPDFDEGARKNWDSRVLPRRHLLQLARSRETLSRRHVVCLLPRRAEPRQAACGPGESTLGKSQLERRRAVLLVGSRLRLERRHRPAKLRLPGVAHVAARHARHVARLDRQHQQPALDERGVLPLAAHGARQEVGQGNDLGRRPGQQAVQRIRPADRFTRPVLRAAVDNVDATGVEGRSDSVGHLARSTAST